jgi:hypothetical protein
MNDLPAAPAPPRSRWMERLTGALLFSAAVVTLVPVVPAALRSLGVGVAPAPVQGAGTIAQLLPRRGSTHPRLDLDERSRADEERAPSSAGLPTADPDGEPARIRVGVAPRGLKLLDEPSPGSARVGEIAAGELVMIVRESGEWAFIARNGDDGVIMGWARRSEIAVR